jgi:hypothetical protein
MERSEIQAKIWKAYERGDLILACAWCTHVHLEGEWVHADRDTLSSIDAAVTLSHGICPTCLENQVNEPLRMRLEPPTLI